ncbi:MAG: hypothetical protein KJ000_01125 [Pirellulaceae bacterium]|nr:hypothetical protein [Pirellulaceae bacterium]
MASNLPDYVASARPLSKDNRVSWFSNVAPTYAGIMLWFVFWHDVPVGASLDPNAAGQYSAFAGGALAQGLGIAILGLIIAAVICHFLFYLVPALLGMQTGLPLYIVGTSTYGVHGGFIMPGFVMGLLQFGWLAVNAFFAGILLCQPLNQGPGTFAHAAVATLWAIAAAFMGLKGIQYVAKVATFFPLIPLAILVIMFVSTMGGVGDFDQNKLVSSYDDLKVEVKQTDGSVNTLTAQPSLAPWQIIALIGTYVVGFFATAGAAGTDIAMNSRDGKNVQIGGLVGIAGATIVAGGLSLLIVAGVHGKGGLADDAVLRTSALMSSAMGSEKVAAVFMYLLAIAAFPAACFSAFIAANSFKTTLPKVNPFVSVGAGTLLAIVLAVTGVAGNAIGVFTIIGASFGPVCGSMVADFLLSGRRWAGPRAGFNPAGWIAWIIGFVVGAADFIPGMKGVIPCPPVAAFVVGFVLYFLLAKAGMESKSLEMPTTADAQA